MTLTLDGIAPLLHVFDMARSIAFYRDVLDFRVVASTPRGAVELNWCMLVQGDIAIMLRPSWPAGQRPAVEPTPPARGLTLFFGCDDVDVVHRVLGARGWPAAAPVTSDAGMRQLRVIDPDGFELCFQHPADDAG
jgi:glyoxylase I family protein